MRRTAPGPATAPGAGSGIGFGIGSGTGSGFTGGGDRSAGAAAGAGPRTASGGDGPGPAGGRRPAGRLVKICGVTRPADAVAAVELGADLLGLNFHPPSPRYVDAPRAAEIAAAARAAAAVGDRPPPLLVGVFVDLPLGEVEALDRAAGLDLLQFHGDQGPDDLAPWGRRAVKVVRVPRRDPPSAHRLTDALAAYPDAWGFLFDVHHATLHGGTGESFGWSLLAALDRDRLGRRPLLVAGGITPDNARRALAESGADGVDVASGVEAAPGLKDRSSMQRLIQEVRHVSHRVRPT